MTELGAIVAIALIIALLAALALVGAGYYREERLAVEEWEAAHLRDLHPSPDMALDADQARAVLQAGR